MESGEQIYTVLIKSWNKIHDEKCKDIADEDTSGNLVKLIHRTDGCEDMTELRFPRGLAVTLNAWISSSLIIITPEEGFKESEVSYINCMLA